MIADCVTRGKWLGLLFAASVWLCGLPAAIGASSGAPSAPAAAQAPFAIEVSSVSVGRTGAWAEVSITVTAAPSVGAVTITGRGPAGLSISPESRTIEPGPQGRPPARFRIHNPKGDWANLPPVAFVAKSDVGGTVHTVQAVADWPRALERESIFHAPHWTWLAAAIAAVALVLVSRRARSAIDAAWRQLFDPRVLFEVLALAVVEAFIISKLAPELLFTATTTTGGDTASHFYTLQYLRDTLLPAGQVSGWTPGNYAGFPILQFYFPLGFLLMSALGGILSLQVAFKLGSIAGTLLLPVAAYAMLRLMRCPFPAPGIGAALTLPFLFNSANSMWGGNILSTFAGEFSYSLSMTLSLILMGSLYRGAREDRGVIANAVLVFLVGFSHGYTLLFAEAMSLYLLMVPRGFVQRVFYLGKVYALAFCLLAFWLVPLLVFSRYTTAYDLVWIINSAQEIFPTILLPTLVTGALGTLGVVAAGVRRYRDFGKDALPVVGYLWFGLAVAVVFFVAAPRIGVVDIRYVPYGQLLGTLLAAAALGWLGSSLRRWRIDWVLLPAVLVAALVWTGGRLGPVGDWAKWNYEGFETKTAWRTFERINKALKGDFNDPRVVFEHSSIHNSFGSTRAFESLPLFAGRATLEGLYMQASVSAPFVFYIQSEISDEKSVPFPQYSYSSMNFDRARPHLELFNVRDLIIRSDLAKKSIRSAGGYRLKDTIGEYELWQLTTNRNRYVEVPEYEPVLYPTSAWKEDAYRWFTEEPLLKTPLVFAGARTARAEPPFKALEARLEQVPRIPVQGRECRIAERIGNQHIDIETDCIGKPHLVKMSYHPNWHVDGAERIYLASPSFMLVYPTQRQVRLYYGPGVWDRLGQFLTILGVAILLLNIPLRWRRGGSAWEAIAERLGVPATLVPAIGIDPSPRRRRAVLASVLVVGGVAVAWGSYAVYRSNPNREHNLGIELKDRKRYAEARERFYRVLESRPLSNIGQNSAYYIGITYYLEKKDREAIAAFEDLIRRYPKSLWVPEVKYHIGLSLFRLGEESRAVATMNEVRSRHEGTPWARYAEDRLNERSGAKRRAQLPLDEANVVHAMGVAIDHFNHDRLGEARALFQEISSRFPGFSGAPQALAGLALTYYKQGDCAGTMTHYRKLLERYPRDRLVAEAYFHLGVCSERLGDPKAGQAYFSKLLQLNEDSPYTRQARQRKR